MDREVELSIVDEIGLLLSKIKQVKTEINHLSKQRDLLLLSKVCENKFNFASHQTLSENPVLHA